MRRQIARNIAGPFNTPGSTLFMKDMRTVFARCVSSAIYSHRNNIHFQMFLVVKKTKMSTYKCYIFIVWPYFQMLLVPYEMMTMWIILVDQALKSVGMANLTDVVPSFRADEIGFSGVLQSHAKI